MLHWPGRSIRMASTLPKLPVFEAIARHDPESIAIVHSYSGRRFKYGELLGDVCRTRDRLYEKAGRTNMDGERVAFLIENSYDYVGKQGRRHRNVDFAGHADVAS
jgi:malonyl-CoA/methylmalonyl-CoA synthetase